MKKKWQIISVPYLIVISMALLWACANNGTSDMTGTNNGGGGNNSGNSGGNSNDTTSYYATTIQPIFTASCSGSSCHIPGPRSGVTLSDYSNVLGSIGNQYGIHIVQPGDAAKSPIIDKLSNASPKFGIRMPPSGPLSQDKIDTLKAWINRGAKKDS